MNFKDKYSTKDEEGKIKITSEAYAVGEMLQEVVLKLNQAIARLK